MAILLAISIWLPNFFSFFLSLTKTLFHAIRIWRAQDRIIYILCHSISHSTAAVVDSDRCLRVCMFLSPSLNTSLDLRMRYSFYSVAARFKTNIYILPKQTINSWDWLFSFSNLFSLFFCVVYRFEFHRMCVCVCVSKVYRPLFVRNEFQNLYVLKPHSHTIKRSRMLYTFLDTHSKYEWVELTNAGQVNSTHEPKITLFWCKEMNECEIRLSDRAREREKERKRDGEAQFPHRNKRNMLR